MRGVELILRQLENCLTAKLNNCGIMYRVFSRAKTQESILKKLAVKGEKYRKEGTKMQDLLGFRVTLYFSDDVQLFRAILKSEKYFHSESANIYDTETFCPQVLNIICHIPDELIDDFHEIKLAYSGSELIDDTYEVQIRTVLSEGWHEVEHDLRYKCAEDWDGHDDYKRLLNGVFATLETSEWSMLSIFENLAHAHYKSMNWDAMLRNKMRIRLVPNNGKALSLEIKQLLTEDRQLAKRIYRTSRKKVLSWIMQSSFSMPLQYDTVMFLINRIEVKDERLIALENPILSEEFVSLGL